MKVMNVRVIPNAKKNDVSEEKDQLKVRLKAKAVGGKANKALIEVLAEFFNVKKSDVKITRGERSREKVIEVDMDDDYIANAEKVKIKLESIFTNAIILFKEGDFFKVRILGIKSQEELQKYKEILLEEKLSSFVVEK